MRMLSVVTVVLALATLVLSGCAPTARAAPAENRPIEIAAVNLEVGVGSPIPVEVVAAGTWPDLCAQLAEVRQAIRGTEIDVTLLATPAQADCPPDFLGLPLRLALPLNVVELPAGAYTVTINGVSTTFDLPVTPRQP
jgi:hypothetical protein